MNSFSARIFLVTMLLQSTSSFVDALESVSGSLHEELIIPDIIKIWDGQYEQEKEKIWVMMVVVFVIMLFLLWIYTASVELEKNKEIIAIQESEIKQVSNFYNKATIVSLQDKKDQIIFFDNPIITARKSTALTLSKIKQEKTQKRDEKNRLRDQ